MDRETMRKIVREQRAGFEAFHRIEVEEWKRATVEERWRDLNHLYAFAVSLDRGWPSDYADEVRSRWRRLRDAYERK